ncbi:MAG: hypothetical protein JSV65_04725, partial [Armatimonadota bacterium]
MRMTGRGPCCCAFIVASALAVAAFVAVGAGEEGENAKVIVTADNPDPQRLPTLGVWERDTLLLVSATFPNVPDFTCDSWCYESPVDYVEARALDGGRIELRHRLREQPSAFLVTTVTPEPGAVEFVARVEPEAGSAAELTGNLLAPNLCWQLIRAPGFASKPDPYPEFVKRCFIFTEKGRAFLHETVRRKIPCREPEDVYNNPPWVQMYAPVGEAVPEVGPTSWADYSTDQYMVPIIGAVSRDGKYLAALVNDSATVVCQAWHDCMHNNPAWLPV